MTDTTAETPAGAPVDAPADAPVDDRPAKRAVALLFWGQSVLGAQMPVHFVLGGLAGQLLAPDPFYATLPISMIVLGSMLSAPLMAWVMQRFGRRTGFVLAALAGAVGGGLAAEAILLRSFELFCAATLITGIYLSGHNFFRFAAADLASPAFRPKAIAWVMAGGLIAAVLGPELVKGFEDWLSPFLTPAPTGC